MHARINANECSSFAGLTRHNRSFFDCSFAGATRNNCRCHRSFCFGIHCEFRARFTAIDASHILIVRKQQSKLPFQFFFRHHFSFTRLTCHVVTRIHRCWKWPRLYLGLCTSDNLEHMNMSIVSQNQWRGVHILGISSNDKTIIPYSCMYYV